MTASKKNIDDRLGEIEDNAYYRLTEWEEKFVKSLYKQLASGKELSEKQLAIVDRIEASISKAEDRSIK